jgi:hypothetical protein
MFCISRSFHRFLHAPTFSLQHIDINKFNRRKLTLGRTRVMGAPVLNLGFIFGCINLLGRSCWMNERYASKYA